MASKDHIIEEIPAKVYAACRYNAEGESWEGACKIVGITPKTVRKYRDLPQVQNYREELIKEKLSHSKQIVINAFPTVLKALIKRATNENEKKGYVANGASQTIVQYMIHLEQNIEMRKKFEELQQQVAALEGGRTINMYRNNDV